MVFWTILSLHEGYDTRFCISFKQLNRNYLAKRKKIKNILCIKWLKRVLSYPKKSKGVRLCSLRGRILTVLHNRGSDVWRKTKEKKNAVLHTAWQTYAWWLHSLIHMFFPVLCKMGTCAYTYSCVCIHTHTHTRVCMYTYICASKTYLAFLPRLQKRNKNILIKTPTHHEHMMAYLIKSLHTKI